MTLPLMEFVSDKNLELDIDYILQWNQPEIEGFCFTFWISPATLIFDPSKRPSFELTKTFDDKWLEIEDIEREVTDNVTRWTIITRQGDLSFNANTFQQIIRRKRFALFISAPIPATPYSPTLAATQDNK